MHFKIGMLAKTYFSQIILAFQLRLKNNYQFFKAHGTAPPPQGKKPSTKVRVVFHQRECLPFNIMDS